MTACLILRNNPARAGFQYDVFVTSRWFPAVLAVAQVVRHVALLAYDYWRVGQNEKSFDIGGFISRDLARPLFEPSGFCGEWVSYLQGQSANVSLDMPAYLVASLFHSAVNWHAACETDLMTPRGQIICLPFVAALWFVTGLSIRRLAQRRWRRRTEGRWSQMMVSLGLFALPIGVLLLLVAVAGLFTSEIGFFFRGFGLAFWMLYVSLLSAERLRYWPFAPLRD